MSKVFDKILLGRYVQLDSWVHRLDPRTKLLGSLYFVMMVFLAQNWLGYALLSLYTLLAVKLTNLSLKFFWNGLKPLIGLMLFTVIFQILFSKGGTVYWQWGPLSLSSGGIESGIFIFIRLVLIIVMSTILTLTTTPLALTDGIEHLLRPFAKFGFPAHEFALMLSIALRFVPTLLDEAHKIMNAQRSRGVEFDQGNFLQRVKAIVPILVPLFVSAFNRAEEMATAMEARGYRGSEGRSKYRQLAFSSSDGWAGLSLMLMTALLIALKYIGI